MKKRYAPIITFTIAILLVGSIAYATDKRKKARISVQEPNEIHEEEALKAELLAAIDDQHKILPDTTAASSNKKVGDIPPADKGKVK